MQAVALASLEWVVGPWETRQISVPSLLLGLRIWDSPPDMCGIRQQR